VQLAERDSPDVRRVPVPVVEHPAGGYDLIAVCVRAHQVDAVLESLADVDGDVLFLLNLGGRRRAAGRGARPVPRAFGALQTLPEWLLIVVLRRFLRSTTAVHSGLSSTSPAAAAELERLAEQLRAGAKAG
jgi:hypothetical protein